jgi:O-antigen/teichoic acid export membrane protein
MAERWIQAVRAKFSESVGADARDRSIAQNVLLSGMAKALSMVANFALLPLSLSFVGQSAYGVWLTLGALLGWFALFDVGIGNGLRNKLTAALATGDTSKARRYVSSAYFRIAAIFGAVAAAFGAAAFFVPWPDVLNAPAPLSQQLLPAVLITFFALCAQFVLRLVSTVLQALHHAGWADLVNAGGSLSTFGLLSAFQWAGRTGDLFQIALLYALPPIAVYAAASIWIFRFKWPALSPARAHRDAALAREVSHLGFQFFFLQIAALLLLTAQNFIVAQLFGPEEVTVFSAAQRYFSLLTVGWLVVLTPFWGLFSEAHARGDWGWIRQKLRWLFRLWAALALFGLLLLGCSDLAYAYWLSGKIEVPLMLSAAVMAYNLVVCLNNITAYFLNAVGKMRLSVLAGMGIAAASVPICLLAHRWSGGAVSAVPLAFAFCLTVGGAMQLLQVWKVVRGNAQGIWNR